VIQTPYNPVVGMFVAGADARSKSATFVFSADGVLRSVGHGGSSTSMGGL
jgi:hypothetical protein